MLDPTNHAQNLTNNMNIKFTINSANDRGLRPESEEHTPTAANQLFDFDCKDRHF